MNVTTATAIPSLPRERDLRVVKTFLQIARQQLADGPGRLSAKRDPDREPGGTQSTESTGDQTHAIRVEVDPAPATAPFQNVERP